MPYVANVYAGTGERGYLDGPAHVAQFDTPSGIVESGGFVFVADTANNRIRVIDQAGVVSTFAGSGVAGTSDGIGTAANINNPGGIAVNMTGGSYISSVGNFAISQTNRIRTISSSAVVTTLAGLTAGFADGTGTSARFNSPQGLTFDYSGNIYVADKGNHAIRKVTPAGVVTTLAGQGTVAGFVNGTGSAARFNGPYAIVFDGTNLYVADSDNFAIRKVTLSGVVTTLVNVGLSGYIAGLALGLNGNLYASIPIGTQKIIEIALPTPAVFTMAETSAAGEGIAQRFDGGFYLSDYQGNQVFQLEYVNAPNFETLVDTFDSLDESRWDYGPRIYCDGTALHINGTSVRTNGYTHNLAADPAVAHISGPNPFGTDQFSFRIWTTNTASESPSAWFWVNAYTGGGPPDLVMAVQPTSTWSTLEQHAIPYDPTAYAWLRIRQDGGNLIQFDTSPDGVTWTNRFSSSTPLRPMDDCSIQLLGDGVSDGAIIFHSVTMGAFSADFSSTDPAHPLDETIWNYGARTYTDAGALVVDRGWLNTRSVYELLGARCVLQVSQFDAGAELFIRDNATHSIFDLICGTADNPGYIFWRAGDYGSPSDLTDFIYDPVTTAYLGFRVDDVTGIGYFETSPDALTWTTVITSTAPMQLSNATFETYAPNYGVVRLESVNVAPPPLPPLPPGPLRKLETLVDDFLVRELDPTKWTADVTGLAASANRLALPRGDESITSQTFYDLTGSYIFGKVEITQPVTAGFTITTFDSDALQLTHAGGQLQARQTNGTTVDMTSVPYDPVAHAYWKIREANGIAYWETSPDGHTWSVVRQSRHDMHTGIVRFSFEVGVT